MESPNSTQPPHLLVMGLMGGHMEHLPPELFCVPCLQWSNIFSLC